MTSYEGGCHCGRVRFRVSVREPVALGISTNLRCFDGDATSRFEIRPFDGENWQDNVASIR